MIPNLERVTQEPDALASIADIETLFGPIPIDDYPKVQRLIEWASAAVRRYCRQTISLMLEHEITIPSTGTIALVLPERPVIAVESVTVLMGPVDWHEYAPMGGLEVRAGWATEGRFTWDAWGRLTRLDGLRWGSKFDPVEVVYSHGYDPIPGDIVGLVAGKVSSFLGAAGSNPTGLKSLQTGAMSETYANAAGTASSLGPGVLTEAEKEILRDGGYRLSATSVQMGTQ
jgi:hypothetical protein